MSEVSIVGTGLMGAALARALLAAGKSVTVWNRTPDKAQALVRAGAEHASSAQAALAASPASIVVVKSYDVVRSLLAEAPAMQPPLNVVNLSTGSPKDADALAQWCAEAGMSLLEGAVYAYPADIGSQETQIFYSGDPGLWEVHQDLLTILGGRSTFLGSAPSLANTLDQVALNYTASTQVAMLEAAAFGTTAGLALDSILAFFAGSAQSPREAVHYAGPKLQAGDVSGQESTVDTWLAAVEGVVETVDRLGLRGGQVRAAMVALRAISNEGFGAADICASYFRELNDVNQQDIAKPRSAETQWAPH